MKKTLLLLLVLFFIHHTHAQEEYAWWFFGNGAAVEFTPNPQNRSSTTTTPFTASSGTPSTISDSQGNFIFYSNGNSIYDRRGMIMPNGNNILGVSGAQSTLIVPGPDGSQIYYLFAIDTNGGLTYNRIEMQLNGGYGDVVPGAKNISLLQSTVGKISGIHKTNSNNVYITTISKNNSTNTVTGTGDYNSIYTYELITTTGSVFYINPTPISQQNNLNENRFESSVFSSSAVNGSIKFSPDGQYLAISNYGSPSSSNANNGVFLLEFNPVNGQFNTPILQLDNSMVNSVEFSIDSNYLYYDTYSDYSPNSSSTRSFIQYDLTNPSNILNTQQLITTSTSSSLGSLQLGIDGELYVSESQSQHLGTINNSTSTNPTYNSTYLDISPSFAGLLPNFMPSLILSNYNATLSSNSIDNELGIDIYPNPVIDYLNVNSSDNIAKVTVTDLQNKQVIVNDKIDSHTVKIDITKLSSGIYLLHIQHSSGNEIIKKIIKE